MTTVWVLNYEWGECVEVFSTEELAREYARKVGVFNGKSFVVNAWLDEKELDRT